MHLHIPEVSFWNIQLEYTGRRMDGTYTIHIHLTIGTTSLQKFRLWACVEIMCGDNTGSRHKVKISIFRNPDECIVAAFLGDQRERTLLFAVQVEDGLRTLFEIVDFWPGL